MKPYVGTEGRERTHKPYSRFWAFSEDGFGLAAGHLVRSGTRRGRRVPEYAPRPGGGTAGEGAWPAEHAPRGRSRARTARAGGWRRRRAECPWPVRQPCLGALPDWVEGSRPHAGRVRRPRSRRRRGAENDCIMQRLAAADPHDAWRRYRGISYSVGAADFFGPPGQRLTARGHDCGMNGTPSAPRWPSRSL